MVTDKIYLLPLTVFVLLPGTFIITYVISVSLGHVEPDFPYISDTGTHSPESCIFGQLLNLVAFLIAITVYTRYKQIHIYYGYHLTGDTIPMLNRISLCLGLVASLGLSIVANFQETNIIVVHLIGALLCFGPGTVYIWVQAALSYLVCPVINKIYMAHGRLFLAIVCTTSFLTSCIAGPISLSQFHGQDKTKWYPGDGGFELHVVSTVAEWILAISFDIFILTFVREFQRITMASPQVYLAIEEMRSTVPFEETGSEETGEEGGRDNPPFRELLA